MSKVVVIDNLPEFSRSAKLVLNDAMREASRDILIKAKQRAPFKNGQLRSDSEVKMMVPLRWRISFWKEYARYQEFGGDTRRTIRKYTTSGTGKHFLSKSGDEIASKMQAYYNKHAGRARS